MRGFRKKDKTKCWW